MGYPNIVPADWWETELGWRNFFEHIPAVQLNHRLLAYSTGVPYMCALYVCLCVYACLRDAVGKWGALARPSLQMQSDGEALGSDVAHPIKIG